MSDGIKITVVGGEKFSEYISGVNERLKSDLDKSVENMASGTKRVIRRNLYRGHGVDEDVYRKSLIYRNLNKGFAKQMNEIHFAVGAKSPHYRLAHLLEKGHMLVYFGHPTNYHTREIIHMAKGQEYAEDRVEKAFEKGIQNAFKKG